MVSGSYTESCFTPSGRNTCYYFDVASTCNTCSPDVDLLTNMIPAGTNIELSKGVCGCVLEIQTPCTNWFNLIGLLEAGRFFLYECSRMGQQSVNAILNQEPCNGCDVAPATEALAAETPGGAVAAEAPPNEPLAPDAPTPYPQAANSSANPCFFAVFVSWLTSLLFR